jgi:hypothetical protein
MTMQKLRYALGLALLMAASLYLLPALQAADNPVPDSPEVSDLLAQAKSDAVQLRDDADVMRQYGMSQLSWESHAGRITMIKEHINDLGKVLRQMDERREWASSWQQKAIDQVTPLASEMASSIEATIDHLNKNKHRVRMPQLKEYLSANYELSSSLSKLIGDYVSYGKSKAAYERLGSELEAPGH